MTMLLHSMLALNSDTFRIAKFIVLKMYRMIRIKKKKKIQYLNKTFHWTSGFALFTLV